MSNLLKFIEDFWNRNEAGGKPADQILQALSPDVVSNVYIGYNELGNRSLFLKTKNASLPAVQSEKTNISLLYSEYNSLVYIELTDKYFGEIFNDLIVSIFSKLKGVPEENNYKTFIALYRKWDELFKTKAVSSRLSDRELLGLTGELTFLKNLLQNAADSFEVNTVLDSWSGPEGSPTDFVFKDICYEIKTIETQKNFIDISSEYQLSSPQKPVHLVVYKAAYDEGGVTLSDLIAEVRRMIDEKFGDTEKFLFKLHRLNIDFKNTGYYQKFRVKLSQPAVYNTSDESFPKITVNSLAEGVFGVKYKLYLDSILKYKV